MANVAVLGYGVVGSGVVEIINNSDNLDLNLKYILDIRDFTGSPIEKYVTKDFDKILRDDTVDVVAEVIGGLDPAYDYVKRALASGKTVVTSNKALVAAKGCELLETAKANGVNYLFEASSGGVVPVIRAVKDSFCSDTILTIKGVLNGTTNYILSKMTKEGASFSDALKEAQLKGFAEKDPSEDVDGFDTARKISILTSLAAGRFVDYKDIRVEGVGNIEKADIDFAREAGGAVKLFAVSKRVGNGFAVAVAPAIASRGSAAYTLDDMYNAVTVIGKYSGELAFYGAGAGKLPTAAAVVADIINSRRHNGFMGYYWTSEKLKLIDFDDIPENYFIRAASNEKLIRKIFDDNVVIFASDYYKDQLAFLTVGITGRDLKYKLSELEKSVKVYSKFLFQN